MSPAEYARSQGWAVGTRIEVTGTLSRVEVEITAIGEARLVAKELIPGGFETFWSFEGKDWTVTHKPARRVKSAAPGPAEAREHMAASLEWGVSPLVGVWCE